MGKLCFVINESTSTYYCLHFFNSKKNSLDILENNILIKTFFK